MTLFDDTMTLFQDRLSQREALTSILLGVVLLSTVVLFGANRNKKRSALPLPPGPKKLPLLGNLLDMPKSSEWLQYAKWSKEYNSDIIHLNVAGSDFIVINTLQAATELLDRRSTNYSSRPQFKVLSDYMGWKWLLAAMPYGERWRERRKLFNQYFRPSNSSAYESTHLIFIRKMLVGLVDASASSSSESSQYAFREVLRQTFGGMALHLAYGFPMQRKDDPYLELAHDAVETIIEATTPGAMLVEIMPVLRYLPGWFPGADFQRRLGKNKKLQEMLRELPFEATVNSLAAGTAKPAFMSTAMMNIDERGDIAHQEEVIKDTAGIVFVAGADAILSGVATFFLAMMQYPAIQSKAQEELDRVLGAPAKRFPDYEDQGNLPYVTAIVNEVLRWKPAGPTGFAHLASEEDVYNGWRIPKGSIVFGNSWAMLHDEQVYPEPETFNPERWLTKDGKLNPEVPDPALSVFGFGRRVCPGAHIALSATWLLAATVLSTLCISKPQDEKGQPIEQEIDYVPGLVCYPAPFKCSIKPRSKEAEALIRSVEDD